MSLYKPSQDKARRREWAKVGGKARGRQQRRLAAHTGRRRSLQLAMAETYPVQLVSRKAFEQAYAAFCAERDLRVSVRGEETLWQLYRGHARRYKARGQDFQTTNGRCARGMAIAGRERCERTMQRGHRRLEAMGLLRTFHVKRRRALAGHRDSLRVLLTPKFCHPASGSASRGPSPLDAGASSPERRTSVPAHRDRIAAPDGARPERPPGAAGNGSDEEEGAERSGRLLPDGRAEEDRRGQVAERRESLRDARARLEELLRAGPPRDVRDRGPDGG